jgi:hypothetical protein
MPKINFFAASPDLYQVENPPVPAKQLIPNWYKDIPPERDFGIPTLRPIPRNMGTVKKCIPFMDALTTGYMIRFPQDILIKKKDGKVFSYWDYPRYGRPSENPSPTEIPIFDLEWPLGRYEGLPTPKGYYPTPWRLEVYPVIQTPPGYSVLITHPFNRYDLPFLALTGVIDTDKLINTVAITLYLHEDFEGILEKDMPVAQVFPFKRENWEHSNPPALSEEDNRKERFKLKSKLVRSYQTQFWSKKTYN